jgi:amino acid adenylation domain-containing protein
MSVGSSGLSPAQQAEFERRLRAAGIEPADDPPIGPRPRSGRVRLSFGQERLWFLDRLDPAGVAYNVAVSVGMRGDLEVEALRRALGELMVRHEVLRTTIEVDPATAEPLQRVHPPTSAALEIVDLESAKNAEATARRLVFDQAVGRFDLATGPLWRAVLIRFGPGDHRLGLTFHHLLVDAWSLGVLVAELGRLYKAFVQGLPSPLPPPALQYADYATWQRDHLAGGRLDRQLDYWRGQLAGAPPLDLPTDHPRPATPSSAGAQISFSLPASLAARLRQVSRGEGTTLFMALLAAFQTLLSHYSGQTDVCVGTPTAGRTRPELEDLVGFFVNTLVMRTDLAGRPTYRELLRRVRDTTVQAYEHQDVPFDQVVQHLQPGRDLDRTPLFQVMFGLQNAPWTPVTLDRLHIAAESVDTRSSMFDLMLLVTEDDEGPLSGLITYRTDLFTDSTIARFTDHFTDLLHTVAADPDVQVADLAEPTGDERHRLLAGNRNAAGPAGDEPLVTDLVERQVDGTPDAVALRFGDERLDYRTIDERANRLAHHLRRSGVGPERLVVVCLGRTPHLVIAQLATLKAGGGYVPVDPDDPPDRLAALIADADATVVITEQRFLERLPREGRPIVCLDRDAEAIGRHSTDRLSPASGPARVAYVRYTSGSTGRPKGVAVSAAGQAWFVRAAGAEAALGPATRVLARSNVTFDIAETELIAPLCHGGSVVLLGDEEARDPRAIATAIGSGDCTVAQATPSLWRAVLGAGLGPAPDVTFLAAGEALTGDLAGRLRALGQGLINLYGPTEATVYATIAPVTAEDEASPPIGRPFGASSAYVLDGRMRLVRQGVVGELYVGGAGVARGYLGRPERTADRFVPDPYGETPGARLYRTGDLVRRRSNGALEYLGRVDDQVKIRGIRVEPGEVRAALVRHPAVADAAVVARDDPAGVRLIAYVVSHAPVDPPVLREHVLRHLPSAMVPAAFVEIAALPLNGNGKLDRAALPEPEIPDSGSRRPGTPEEELLAAICAGLLGRATIGADDDIFALGGHSLMVTQLVARIEEVFSVGLPLRVVFETPTVAGLAAAIAARAGSAPPPEIGPADRSRPVPLSFAQQRLWFLDRLDPDGVAYNIAETMVLRGVLDAAALRRALSELVGRHEALRTTIEVDPVSGEPVQRVGAAGPAGFEVVDLTGVPPSEAGAAGARLVYEVASHRFDLSKGPSWRARLVRFGPEEHTLVLTFHHVVVDAWSMEVLLAELAQLYNAFVHDRPSPLSPPALQYADYAAWQRDQLSDGGSADLDYWRARLADLPEPALPADHPRPASGHHRADVVVFTVPPELTAELRELCRRADVTLFMALLAVFQALLSQYSGQTDIVVGVPIAGRHRPGLQRVVGLFVNTLVMRTDLSGQPGFRELLGRVRSTALAAYEHQDMPFERLVEELRPQRQADRSPLIQVTFTLQNALPQSVELHGLDVALEPVNTPAAKFDLTLIFREVDDHIEGDLRYAAELFERATAERMAEHLVELLAGGVRAPEEPLAERAIRTSPAPRTADSSLQRLFAASMADALGIDQVGADEDFFMLGGHSLLAMRLLARLKDALGIELPLRGFFERPTPAGCAAAVAELAGASEEIEQRAELVLAVARLSDDEVAEMLGSARPGATDG